MLKLPEIDFSNAKFLSAETVAYHYGKHHQAYIDKVNKLTEALPAKDLLEIVSTSKGELFNNAAQAWNHTFYWLGMTPKPSELNSDSKLLKAFNAQYGSIADLKEKFIASAASLFGSGWTWLALEKAGHKFEILNTSNTGMPELSKYTPLLVVDVWEHAYYIQYRNSRANYLNEFWSAVNWTFAEDNFGKDNLSVVNELMAKN
jgi:Fe-Mn family superoxide dismutase